MKGGIAQLIKFVNLISSHNRIVCLEFGEILLCIDQDFPVLALLKFVA